ncbi:MAG: PTS sugar transporter subunit IIB [Coriobacteriaceae bacterium]|nr:PTS sugar transporter subunit IIB [Coriobacteriaceae bacterium]MCI7437733.1 PTS sugar transporter subunit IIB [Coriobacteriaceae bacterium]
MKRVPKIQTVCGFGCGSSLMLRMSIEDIAQQHGMDVEVFCGDVSTCSANACDVIFCSVDLSDRISQRAKVPVVAINRLMDKHEVEEKLLAYMDDFEGER